VYEKEFLAKPGLSEDALNQAAKDSDAA